MKISSSVKPSAQMALLRSSSPTCGPTTSSCWICTPASMRLERLLDARADDVACLAGDGLQANRHVTRGAEGLHLRLVEPRGLQRRANASRRPPCSGS